MKNKEFVLSLVWYDEYCLFLNPFKSRMKEIASFIAADLSLEFCSYDIFYSRQIRCLCLPRGEVKVEDNNYIAFEFSIITNCNDDSMVPLLKDTLYEVVYEYIRGYDAEVEIK